MKTHSVLIAVVVCAFTAMSVGASGDAPSTAEKVARIDAGRRIAREIDIVRIGALLGQMAGRYNTTEIAVADIAVKAAEILREKYGISVKLQQVLEDLNRIAPKNGTKDALATLAVAYIQLRNSGMDGAVAIAAIQSEIPKAKTN